MKTNNAIESLVSHTYANNVLHCAKINCVCKCEYCNNGTVDGALAWHIYGDLNLTWGFNHN